MIREHYAEDLTLDDLASEAVMSKFYFVRTFQKVVGVTPVRFLSAFRLDQAKRLLRTTSLNVSDISSEVGYNSTGSFTRRFTESVGCTPIRYRTIVHNRSSVEAPTGPKAGPRSFSVSGSVKGAPSDSKVYVGVFEGPIFEREPVASCTLTRTDRFQISGVPMGTWYVHAVARRTGRDSQWYTADPPLLIDRAGPLRIEPSDSAEINLVLQPRDWMHPPLLFELFHAEPWTITD